MALTKSEMEAKLAAIEDRLEMLSQFVESLETRVDRKEDLWADWALILRAATAVIDGKARQTRDVALDGSPSVPAVKA